MPASGSARMVSPRTLGCLSTPVQRASHKASEADRKPLVTNSCASTWFPRVHLSVPAVILFSIWVQPAAASLADSGIQRLPVIDKQDIRFDAVSIGGKPVLALAR